MVDKNKDLVGRDKLFIHTNNFVTVAGTNIVNLYKDVVLLLKNNKIRMQQKFSLLILLSFIVFGIACTKADVQFGNDYLDNEYTKIVKVDTFSADLSTVYIDSFATSAKSTILIGGYSDGVFGKIKTTSYFEVTPPAYEDIYDNTTYDSLTLFLKLNKTYYGDTTKPVHIDVRRLSEAIVAPNSGFTLYNTSFFAAFPATIGTRDILISPNRTDSISIKLDNALGQELYRMLRNKNSDTLKQSNIFLNFFKGIQLSSGTTESLIFGCRDSVTMRLHYTKPGLFKEDKTVSFTLANTTHQFNNITVDRSLSTVAGLRTIGPAKKEVHSSTTDNAAYIQPVTGLIAKIRFSSLREILKVPNFAKILKAQLFVKPVAASFDRTINILPPLLRLSLTNTINDVGTDLTAISGNGSSMTQYGSLSIDYLYGISTSYSYDVTNYVKFAITDVTTLNYGLLLSPPNPSFETSFNRLIAGSNRNNADSKIQLVIYYATVQ